MTPDENRKRYPGVAALVDEVRKSFPHAGVTKITPLTTEMERAWLRRKDARRAREKLLRASGR